MPAPRKQWGVNTPVYRVLNHWVEREKETLVCNVPPNAITILGMFAGGLAVAALDRGSWGVLILFAFIRELCDILDGVLARQCSTGSRGGAVLDVLSDSLYVWAAAFVVVKRLWPGRRAGDWAAYALSLAGSTIMADEMAHVLRGTESDHGESAMGRNSILAGPVLISLVKLYLDAYG